MESAVAVSRRTGVRLPVVGWDAVAAWATSFGLVLYLALRGGGFDQIVLGEVGVIAWWVVLLVAAVGLLPRLKGQAWAAIALLAGFAVVSALGISGALSHERAVAETGRVVAYLGVLIVALTLAGRTSARHIVHGAATAMGVVIVLAVLSRLHPQSFPHQALPDFLPASRRRLSYPLNYWNALAAFMAMGAVLLLGIAATARHVLFQALAAAIVPLSALGVFLCVSRGGAIVLVLGVFVFMALTIDRPASLLTVLVAGGGSALLISAASQRELIKAGLDTAAARSEGSELLWLCLLVCGGVGLVQTAIALAARHGNRPRWLTASPRATVAGMLVGTVLGFLFIVGSPLGGEISDAWHKFKSPPTATNQPSTADVFARLQSSEGQGRWQLWASAMDAYRSDRGSGIGAGGFQLWWPAHGTIAAKVDDAHSLYAQTLGELGLPGAMLLFALVALTLVAGGLRAVRAGPSERPLLAGAVAAIAVFWADAVAEWIWQLPVLPAAMLLLVAAVLGRVRRERPEARWHGRVIVGLLSVVALVAVALPLAEASQLRRSQEQARAGDYTAALGSARSAAKLEPSAAGPRLQQALVLEAARRLEPALAAARRATKAEPQNWMTWFTRSRIEARLGHRRAALTSFRRARALNPRSTIFRGT